MQEQQVAGRAATYPVTELSGVPLMGRHWTLWEWGDVMWGRWWIYVWLGLPSWQLWSMGKIAPEGYAYGNYYSRESSLKQTQDQEIGK